MKSSGGSKREELYETLLNGLTDETAANRKPILWVITNIRRGNCGPTEEEIRTLTEEATETEGVYLRCVCPPDCRNWALENWGRMIPFAKKTFLEWARENNDTQFLEAVQEFDRQSGC
jgi:hypothetical protein